MRAKCEITFASTTPNTKASQTQLIDPSFLDISACVRKPPFIVRRTFVYDRFLDYSDGSEWMHRSRDSDEGPESMKFGNARGSPIGDPLGASRWLGATYSGARFVFGPQAHPVISTSDFKVFVVPELFTNSGLRLVD
jgi:hypothetical protein